MDWAELFKPPTDSVVALLSWIVLVQMFAIGFLWRAKATVHRQFDKLRAQLIERANLVPKGGDDAET